MSRQQRILRTGNALTLAAVEQYAPAVFAATAHPTRGPRYEYLPTIKPLEALLERGWGVFEVNQNKTRDPSREGFTRHSLRLRRLDQMEQTNKYGGALDGTLELSLTNAHDGTAAYSLSAGYFRMVCANSMTTGRQIATHRVVHSKGRAIGEIIDVTAKIIEEDFPRMLEQITAFKATELTQEQTYELANTAIDLRYGTKAKLFPADHLLKARRPVDDGFNAWAVLNRIQENVMQGGWTTQSLITGRKSTIRSVEAIAQINKINTGLWTACEEMVTA